MGEQAIQVPTTWIYSISDLKPMHLFQQTLKILETSILLIFVPIESLTKKAHGELDHRHQSHFEHRKYLLGVSFKDQKPQVAVVSGYGSDLGSIGWPILGYSPPPGDRNFQTYWLTHIWKHLLEVDLSGMPYHMYMYMYMYVYIYIYDYIILYIYII